MTPTPPPTPPPDPAPLPATSTPKFALAPYPDGTLVYLVCALCGRRELHRVGDQSRWKLIVATNGQGFYACPGEVPLLLATAAAKGRFISRIGTAIEHHQSGKALTLAGMKGGAN